MDKETLDKIIQELLTIRENVNDLVKFISEEYNKPVESENEQRTKE